MYEFTDFYSEGMLYNTNLFSQCFYTLVGFHGFHVFHRRSLAFGHGLRLE